MGNQWSSLERVRTALEHKEPDRIPFDLGGCETTGIHKLAYKELIQYSIWVLKKGR